MRAQPACEAPGTVLTRCQKQASWISYDERPSFWLGGSRRRMLWSTGPSLEQQRGQPRQQGASGALRPTWKATAMGASLVFRRTRMSLGASMQSLRLPPGALCLPRRSRSPYLRSSWAEVWPTKQESCLSSACLPVGECEPSMMSWPQQRRRSLVKRIGRWQDQGRCRGYLSTYTERVLAWRRTMRGCAGCCALRQTATELASTRCCQASSAWALRLIRSTQRTCVASRHSPGACRHLSTGGKKSCENKRQRLIKGGCRKRRWLRLAAPHGLGALSWSAPNSQNMCAKRWREKGNWRKACGWRARSAKPPLKRSDGYNRGTPRELFPLPVVVRSSGRAGVSRGRKSKQRRSRAMAKEWEIAKTTMALNSLAGHEEQMSESACTSEAQQHVAEHIRRSVDMLGGPPEGLTHSEALRRLRVGSQYEPEVSAGCVYDRSLISWPERQSQPLSLAALLGKGGEEEIAEFIRLRVKDAGEARHAIRGRRVPKSHWDPRLRDPGEYGRLVGEMRERGLVAFKRTEDITEELGIFVVPKKSGQLRLIADCRRSNEHFDAAEHVWLASGETLSSVELDEEELLHIAQGDLKNAFFQIALPPELQHLFGLRRLRASEAGVTHLTDGTKVSPDSLVSPVLSVVPMGWKWALYWCQRMHEVQLSLSGCGLSARLYDRSGRGVMDDEPAHLVYVDNYAVMGTDLEKVRTMAANVYTHLTCAGLLVHEVEGPSTHVECLGWEIDGKGGVVSPTRKRVWKLKLVLQTVLQKGILRGRDLEKIVGHATFVLLLQRPALSILSAVYAFITKNYHVEQVLWASVRRELTLLEALLPLLWVDLRRSWSPDVRMCDASPQGYGVVRATCDATLVRQAGRVSERWRGSLTSMAPREHFAQWHSQRGWTLELKAKAGATSVESDRAKKEVESDSAQADCHLIPFEEIPGEILRSKWKLCWKGLWRQPEPMPVLEGRCALLAYRHLLRNTRNLGKKLLLLTDSYTVAACLMKGRSSRGKMQGICRAVAALTLATGSSLHVRWMVSESNYADGPSRGLNWASTPSGQCPWH
eukprot:6491135-Amphidinium_carterae.1